MAKPTVSSDITQLVLIYAAIAILDVLIIFLDGVFGGGKLLDQADKIASVTACVVTLLGLVLIYHQLKLQADGSDIESIFTITSQINDAAYRLNFSVEQHDGEIDAEQWGALFRNLMTLYEAACYCFNENMFQQKARIVLRDYLRANLEEMFSNEELKPWLDSIRQEKPQTFSQIDKFRAAPI